MSSVLPMMRWRTSPSQETINCPLHVNGGHSSSDGIEEARVYLGDLRYWHVLSDEPVDELLDVVCLMDDCFDELLERIEAIVCLVWRSDNHDLITEIECA